MSKRNLKNQKGVFLKLFTTPGFRAWSGYAFENICLIHHRQIAKALGISYIFHEFSSFQFLGNTDYKGMQIDLLIDRADGVINLCEIKFSNAKYKLTAAYKEALRERASVFSAVSKSKKSIVTTLITTYGLSNEQEHLDVVQNVVKMDALFEDE